MTIEDDLRRTLRFAADQLPGVGRGPDRLDELAATRRSRRRGTFAVLGAAAVVAAVLAAFVRADQPVRRVETGPAASTPPSAERTQPAPAGGFPGIWPESSFEEYRRSAGRDPSRLDPAAVARAYLAQRLGLRSPALGPFERFDERRGQVGYREGARSGAVILDRPAEGAAYVVAEASADGLAVAPVGAGSTRGVVPGAAELDPLVVTVWSSTGGRGAAKAGPFSSEWAGEAPVHVNAGQQVEVRVDVRPPVPRTMLVRVDLAGTDGVMRVAEFRVDAPAAPGPDDGPRALGDDEVVALTAHGVAVVAVPGGEVVRRVVGEGELGQGASGLSVSPDRRSVLFSRALTGCSSEIVSVPLDGGPVRVLASGTWPVVSPGGRLAYVSDPDCSQRSRIVVRDPVTGRERTWAAAPGGDGLPAVVRSLSWSPDARRLAFELVLEDGREIRVLDVSRGERVLDSTRLRPPDGHSWSSPAFDGAGRLVAVERRGDGGATGGLSVVVVDVVSAAVVDRAPAGVRRLLDLAVSHHHGEVLAVDVDGWVQLVRRDRRLPGRQDVTEAAW